MGAQQNIKVYDLHVKEYVSRFMHPDLYAHSYDALLNYLPANANVVDLGCGPGNVARYLRSKRPDINITGLDVSQKMIEEARKQAPGCTFLEMDITDAANVFKSFDCVICAFALPYMDRKDSKKLFSTAKQLTDTEGIFYISCMEGEAERSGLETTSFTGSDELYINYYERTEITRLLGDHHFAILDFFTVDYKEMDGSVTTDLIYIAKKAGTMSQNNFSPNSGCV